MKYSTTLVTGALAILLCGGCSMQDTSRDALPPGMQTMEMRLQAIVDGKADSGDLTIVYDDVHGLFGGVRTTVHGNGAVEQDVYAPVEDHPEVHDISAEEVRVLAKLLLDIRAWEQQTPERAPLADESRTTLTVRLGAMESQVWEWRNEAVANNRIYKVIKMIDEFAW